MKIRYWKQLTKEQRHGILYEQREYQRRMKENRKTNKTYYRPPQVISTKVISEPSSFKEKYHNFITSPFWKMQRSRLIKPSSRCEICKCNSFLEVHHISYDKVFTAKIASVKDKTVILCRKHHQEFHDLYGLKHDMRKEWRHFYSNHANK